MTVKRAHHMRYPLGASNKTVDPCRRSKFSPAFHRGTGFYCWGKTGELNVVAQPPELRSNDPLKVAKLTVCVPKTVRFTVPKPV